jgi:hypothetical protein
MISPNGHLVTAVVQALREDALVLERHYEPSVVPRILFTIVTKNIFTGYSEKFPIKNFCKMVTFMIKYPQTIS